MSRYVLRELTGYLNAAPSGARPGVSYMVVDTAANHRVVATYRSEDYAAQGRLWARLGAEREVEIRNAEARP